MTRLAFASLLASLALGCTAKGTASKDAEFRSPFFAVMSEWSLKTSKLNEEPPLDLKKMPKEEARKAVAAGIERMASTHREAERQARELPVTPRYAGLRQLTIDFFRGQAERDADWARLVRAGAPSSRDLGKVGQAETLAALRRMLTEIERVEGREHFFAKHLQAIERSLRAN